MSSILYDIEKAKAESDTQNRRLTNLYIGRKQVIDLQQWVYDMRWTSSPTNSFAGEGLLRSEVAGLKVYTVNSEDHLEVV